MVDTRSHVPASVTLRHTHHYLVLAMLNANGAG